VAYKLRWTGDEEKPEDACGSVSELISTVGLFYIGLLCLGLLFVALENAQSADNSVLLARSPHAALYEVLHPGSSGL
jgi:hypothetical protein